MKMRQILKCCTALFLWALTTNLFAQQSEGLITYKETIYFKLEGDRANDPRAQQMMAMMGESQSFTKHLRLKDSATLYILDPAEANKTLDEQDPKSRMQRMMRQENEVYRDLRDNSLLEYTDFMGKKFLISGEPQRKWMMVMDQRTIQGFICFKAVTKDTAGNSIDVWYTPQIHVSSGPRNIGGLPGLVLEASDPNGRWVVKAEKIDFRPLTAEEPFAKPDKGKQVTREEFQKIQAEKLKEMQEQFGKGGGGPWMRTGH